MKTNCIVPLYRLLCTVILLTCANSCKSKKMNGPLENYTVEEIKTMGKRSIVALGKKMIFNDSGQHIPDLYPAKVFTNDKEVLVFFNPSIKYAPMDSSNYHGCSVALVFKSFSYSPLINTGKEQQTDHLSFYQPSERDFERIEYVLDSETGKSWGYDNYLNYFDSLGMEVWIYEKETFFQVKLESESEVFQYELIKETGEKRKKRHRHIRNPPLTQQGYYEIKE